VDINTQYIIDYLENNLSGEEKILFEQRLETSAALRQEVREIRFIWETSTGLRLHKQANTEKNWNQLSHRISVDQFRNKFWRFTRTAAAIMFLPFILTSFFLYQTIRGYENAPVEQIEISSAQGLVTKIMLPDGSEAWLNSGSTLSYPQRFTDGKRRVLLTGEAYFKVQSDKSNRFEVQTNGGLLVSSYGTEFNVFAYDEESTIEVTLTTGNIEVSVDGITDVLSITPRQQVIFNKENGEYSIEDVSLSVKTGWKDGKMVFRRAHMAEIVNRLSRHFNVDIRLEGEEIYGYEYSATFTTETLDEILYLLEQSAPVKCRIVAPRQSDDYSYSKRTVIISINDKR
jgi:ferric-dicitrate binding protein FerR (iron transport regulator)